MATSLASQRNVMGEANALQSTYTSGELGSNQTLPQGTPLYSVDGTVYLEIKNDGTFALFDTASGDIIYLFKAPTSDTNMPFYLLMQLDCNLVLYDTKGGVVFATQTTAVSENPNVTPPCRTVVSGAGGGFIAVIDSFASGDQSDTALYTRPMVGTGVMREGQILPQNVRLYSPDGKVFINVQADGNCVLYNATLKALYGASAATAIADTGNGGLSQFAPFELIMQTDCNAVVYKNVNTTGTVPANAIFETSTYGKGTGCQLIVTSEQGGTVLVVNSANQVLYELPRVPLNPLSTVPPVTSRAPITSPPPSTGFVPTVPGTLLANQDLPQNTPLYSMDRSAYLVMQGDGNLVLYSVAKVAQHGQGALSALFQSGTYGATPAPFTLAMQGDCNLVVYNGHLATTGPTPGNAIYDTSTYNAGPDPCKLVVGSGYFAIITANNAVAFNSTSGR